LQELPKLCSSVNAGHENARLPIKTEPLTNQGNFVKFPIAEIEMHKQAKERFKCSSIMQNIASVTENFPI